MENIYFITKRISFWCFRKLTLHVHACILQFNWRIWLQSKIEPHQRPFDPVLFHQRIRRISIHKISLHNYSSSTTKLHIPPQQSNLWLRIFHFIYVWCGLSLVVARAYFFSLICYNEENKQVTNTRTPQGYEWREEKKGEMEKKQRKKNETA